MVKKDDVGRLGSTNSAEKALRPRKGQQGGLKDPKGPGKQNPNPGNNGPHGGGDGKTGMQPWARHPRGR